MNNKVCLYKVQICNSTNSYYYLATDINAIFERKFDYKTKSVELLGDDFISDGSECIENKNLFMLSLSTQSYIWIIAKDMKDAYKIIYDKMPERIRFFYILEYIAPVQYVKSYDELNEEIENIRIG